MPAIALTDNGNLFGALEFSLKAFKNGIQPIIGSILEIVIDEGNRVVDSIQTRIEFISKTLAQSNYKKGPKTFCIDWLNPLRNTGQWIPELIDL